MDSEFIKWLATLGVGGVLAGLMFAFYRKDLREYTNLWKGQTEMLVQVVKENTAAVTANTMQTQNTSEIINALHRRLDREGSFRQNDRLDRPPRE